MARIRIDWEGQREITATFKLPAKEALRVRNAKYITAFLYVWNGTTGTATMTIESAPDPSYPDAMWNPLVTFSSADLATSNKVTIKNMNAAGAAIFDISEYLRWQVTAGITGTLRFSLTLFIYDV